MVIWMVFIAVDSDVCIYPHRTPHHGGVQQRPRGTRPLVIANFVSPFTEDVDIARREALAMPGVSGFLDMLRATGIEFFEIPSLDRRQRGTSFKERGGSNFKIDLLVPSGDDKYPIVPVPELVSSSRA